MISIRSILFLLFFLSYNGEEPKKICHPSTPFRKNDQTCGNFNEICVKTGDDDCNYFQTACKQCPPSNYSAHMYIDMLDMKSRINRSNLDLKIMQETLNNISRKIIDQDSLNNINRKTIEQVFRILIANIIVCFIFVTIIGIIWIYTLFKKRKKKIENHKGNQNEVIPLLENQSSKQLDGMFQKLGESNVNILEKIENTKNENDGMFQKLDERIVNILQEIEKIKNENVVSYKLRFQIAEYFDETELTVSKFDSVIKIKKVICELNNNKKDYKRMTMKYKDVTLDNNQFLLSRIDSVNIPIFCEFDNNVDVSTMIVVKLKGDNIHPEMLQFYKDQKIEDIKVIISELIKINYQNLLIFYESKELENDNIIENYKIIENTWLMVVNKSEEMQNILLMSIFNEKKTISIETSKCETVSCIIDKFKQELQNKMATDDFVVFLNKKVMQKDKFIYEYNFDSKSLVEFCYFKNLNEITIIDKPHDYDQIIIFNAEHKNTNKSVLLKAYSKKYMKNAHENDLSKILTEDLQIFQITKSHQRFIQLFDIYMDNDYVYIEMENSSRKLMKNFLSNNNKIQEYEMSKWACQILEGLKYLHYHNIILKDMNSFDIMIDGNNDVKLPSFNMTRYLKCSKNDNKPCRKETWKYLAPEILENKDDNKANVDVWSLGIIMIDVVKHGVIFQDLNRDEFLPIIMESRIIEYHKIEKHPELINFIDCCLKVDPKERSTINQLIKHDFIEKYL